MHACSPDLNGCKGCANNRYKWACTQSEQQTEFTVLNHRVSWHVERSKRHPFRALAACCSLVLNSTSEQHCSSIFSPIVPLCRIYSELCPVESVCVPCISRGTQGLSRYDRFWHETMARKTNDFENTQLTHASRPARSSLSRLMTK